MNYTSLGFRQPIDIMSFELNDFNFNTTLLDGILVNHLSLINNGQRYKLTADNGQALRDAVTLNTEISPGLYSVTAGSTNRPAGAGLGLLQVSRRDTNHVFQTMVATETGIIYSRGSANAGSTWSTWRQQVSTVDLTAKLDASLYTAADVLTKIKTVDGSGSGLDADLLQGLAPSAFALVGHNHTLDSLSNTTITSKANNDLIQWNGTAWVNRTLAAAGVAPAVHTHTKASITDFAHTHTIADTTNLQASLDAKAATVHTHIIGDTTGLQSALDGKASTVHTHAIADTTGLQTALDGKAATSHTHTIANVTNLQTTLDGKASAVHSHAISGVTGLQTALDGKQASVSGAATTILSSNLTVSRALVSDGSGKVGVSAVTAAQLGHLGDVTSAIQAQLNGKQANITGGASSIASANLTASRVLTSDASGKVAVSTITPTQLGHLEDVTSAIQAQLNGKQANITGAATTILSSNLTASRAMVSDGSGKVAISAVTAIQLGYLGDVTSNIQAQLNGKLGSTARAADSVRVGGRLITVSTTAPSSPAVGDIWIDIS